MKRSGSHALLVAIVCGVLFSCVSVPEDAGFADVEDIVDDRVGYRLHWDRGSEPDQEVAGSIDRLLAEDLTRDAAVQIALLNNPGLQAIYEELGVTQADVVEAGLLENPTLFGQARFPDGGDGSANLEFEIAQNFLSLLMLPARKKLAAIEFERKKLQVADAVILMAANVSKAYYTALGAITARDLQKKKAIAAENAFGLAMRMKAAGNISDLELAKHQARYEQTRIELAANQEAVLQSREHLNRLMGLWGDRTDWKISAGLPDIPAREAGLENLETKAIENRLDLAAARKGAEAMAQALEITVDWRWVGRVEVGISTERETDRTWLTGPNLSIELPIFNQQQADIARMEARLRQSYRRLSAQAVQIRSEVRTLRDRLVMKRHLVEHYQNTLLPLKQRIVALTLQNYNFMLMGAFALLDAKQGEIDAHQQYQTALRDYWTIRSDLQRALGGSIPNESRAPVHLKPDEMPAADHHSSSG
jgi:cobalt-zinc-cadmium efflux system outer membrane protein